jgi:sortase A
MTADPAAPVLTETPGAPGPRSSVSYRRATAVLFFVLAGSGMLGLAAVHRASGILAQFDAPEASTLAAEALPIEGDAVGRLRIPRLGVDLAVFEGISETVLRKGPGHVPRTALPGAEGNCVIAAHRDGFFRPLRNARAGDRVVLSTASGDVEYRLWKRRVVEPTEVSAMRPTPRPRLTLLTCYPFSWIGPAPSRLIWVAIPAPPSRPAEGGGTAGERGAVPAD